MTTIPQDHAKSRCIRETQTSREEVRIVSRVTFELEQHVVSPKVVAQVAAIQLKISLFASDPNMDADRLIGNIGKHLREQKVLKEWTREEREDLWETVSGFLQPLNDCGRLNESDMEEIHHSIVVWTM